MSRSIYLTTTGTLATVVIDDLGGVEFIHPVVSLDLVAPNGEFEYDEIINSTELGSPSASLQASLNAGHITLTDAAGNPITDLADTTLPVATTTVEGIVSITDQTFAGRKTFNNDKIIIEPTDPGASTTLELGWFNDLAPADPNSFGMRRMDGSGVFSWMSNAQFPQFFMGDPLGTGSAFIDATNNRPLNLNVLDTGVDDPGRVTVGIGGFTISGSSEIAPTNPLTVFRDDTTPILSFEVESDGTITAGNTVSYEALVLADNDIPNKKYVDDAVAVTGGSTIQLTYRYETGTTPPPSSKRFKTNNTTPSSVTQIYLQDQTDNNVDASNLISALSTGDRIYLQQLNDSTRYILASITNITDNTTYWTLDVTIDDSGTNYSNNQPCAIFFLYSGVDFTNTDDLPEGTSNLYYTETRVSNNVSVVANTAKVSADGSVNTHSDVNISAFTPGFITYVNPSGELDTTGVLQVNNSGCSLRTVDDTGLDWCNEQVGTSGSAFVILKKSLGTIGSEAVLNNGDKIGGWGWIAQDLATSNPGYVSLEIAGFATETQSATNGGAELRFQVTNNGTKANVVALTIENDGTLNVSGQTDYELQVTDEDDIPNKKYVDDVPKKTFVYSVSRNANNQGNQFLRRQNGAPTNTVPYIVPYDATIYAATAENNPNDVAATWDFVVEVNTVAQVTLAVPGSDHKVTNNALSVDVNEGDEIRMRMLNQSQTVNHPSGSVFFIER